MTTERNRDAHEDKGAVKSVPVKLILSLSNGASEIKCELGSKIHSSILDYPRQPHSASSSSQSPSAWSSPLYAQPAIASQRPSAVFKKNHLLFKGSTLHAVNPANILNCLACVCPSSNVFMANQFIKNIFLMGVIIKVIDMVIKIRVLVGSENIGRQINHFMFSCFVLLLCYLLIHNIYKFSSYLAQYISVV
jgi:hypothetical protein